MIRTISTTMNVVAAVGESYCELPNECPIDRNTLKIGMARNLKYIDSGRVKADLTILEDYCKYEFIMCMNEETAIVFVVIR